MAEKIVETSPKELDVQNPFKKWMIEIYVNDVIAYTCWGCTSKEAKSNAKFIVNILKG